LAETTTDVLRREGGEIRLEEELELHLPFLLPEDGYSCDSLRGIPKGFQEFLEPICRKGTIQDKQPTFIFSALYNNDSFKAALQR